MFDLETIVKAYRMGRAWRPEDSITAVEIPDRPTPQWIITHVSFYNRDVQLSFFYYTPWGFKATLLRHAGFNEGNPNV